MDTSRVTPTGASAKPCGFVLGARYVVDRVIAQRPLLVAYRAYDMVESKLVVLEVLEEPLVRDLALAPRLKREARLAQQLIHDNMAPFRTVEQYGPNLVCIRDHVDGTSLDDYLHQPGCSAVFYEAMQVLEQVGAALHHAHTAGILHNSVSAHNIALRHDGRVVLLGFGLPSLTGISTDTDLDPGYMSPEQCGGERADNRSDIYSLGVVVYRMCVGRLPHVIEDGEASDGSEWERMCWKHLHEPCPFASRLNPDVPEEASWVLSKALAKRPSERFQSATEFVAVMKRAWTEAGLDPQAMCAEPPPWIRKAETVVPPKIAKTSSEVSAREPRPKDESKRLPALWLVGLFLVVAVVWGVLLAYLWGGVWQSQPSPVYSQGPVATMAIDGHAGVPTWTPPLIPTSTEARTAHIANTSMAPAPTAAVPAGIPFEGLVDPTAEFDWGSYVQSVNWRSYTDPRFGFALTYPHGWTVKPNQNVLRLYMPARDVGVVVCSCGTRTADSARWAARVLESLKVDYPGIEQLEQKSFGAGWLATLARIPQGDDEIQLAVLSRGQGQRGYAVVFLSWASDWAGVKPIFDQMAQDMRFP